MHARTDKIFYERKLAHRRWCFDNTTRRVGWSERRPIFAEVECSGGGKRGGNCISSLVPAHFRLPLELPWIGFVILQTALMLYGGSVGSWISMCLSYRTTVRVSWTKRRPIFAEVECSGGGKRGGNWIFSLVPAHFCLPLQLPWIGFIILKTVLVLYKGSGWFLMSMCLGNIINK